ncbi:hypothetical protein Dpep_2272 [Dethiosulfovibrio peptidovorans DSM 11002]|uniref:Prepilin-type N-terminal cleavage/methylation domain-containing protein n=1 Tax=Dethiosulfovibrio peptidovorans DSM 11002 TaxID=469381 RepID=D2Z433_9BACT|nr:type II secretion system protein [Dethiosulfovibrio peptidovorans]EFC92294.1 hypothetical protein Dpep_2272 [Dethiosulfovibrio peptidovorans DSM 11002]
MICSAETASQNRRAFTLVEVLIALVITSLIMGASVTLLYTFLRNYEESSEYTMALQRGQLVMAYLEPVILSAGLGLPSNPDDFSHCVEDGGLLKAWGEPVSIVDEGSKIRLIYSVVLNAVTADMTDFSPGASISVPLTGSTSDIGMENAYSGLDGKKWISFLSVGSPSVTNSTTSPLSVEFKGKKAVTSAQYDPLLLIRTMVAYVSGGVFYIKDNNGSTLPAVKGVLKVYFEELPGDVIKVSVLTRGDVKGASPISQNNISWPDSNDMPTSDDYRYRLALSSSLWRVRNR